VLPLLVSLLVAADPLASLAAPAGGSVGFAALDLASGRTLALNDRDPFPMQSVFKLPVAIEVLRQVDGKQLELERAVTLTAADARPGPIHKVTAPGSATVRQLLEAMLQVSDNAATDKLCALVGGPRAVDARMRALGVDGIDIRFTEQDLQAGRGDNHATPAAMVALLAKIARGQVGLSPASAKLLDELLLGVVTGVNRIKGRLPAGTPVAHKTGMSGTVSGKTDATNDVGLVTMPNGTRVAIAVFVHASPAGEATRERVIADLARAAYDRFSAR
jgi:beta-lactamase class A